jgi:glycosyltransferase involved in cell wall biosynthesis
VGYRKKELPFKVQPRAAGTTTWNYLSLFNLAVEGITSFTTAPLRLTTMLGLFVSMMAIIYMLVVFFDALLYGDPVAGYPTLMTVMLFLGGVQLLSLGIIGEYLGRVFTESKQRPIYLVDEMDGKKLCYRRGRNPEHDVESVDNIREFREGDDG